MSALFNSPKPKDAMPVLDSETMVLLRGFLTPIFETSTSWDELRGRLHGKGFGLSFRNGRMIVTDAQSAAPVCPVRALGVNLRGLVRRFGRAHVVSDRRGASGRLA